MTFARVSIGSSINGGYYQAEYLHIGSSSRINVEWLSGPRMSTFSGAVTNAGKCDVKRQFFLRRRGTNLATIAEKLAGTFNLNKPYVKQSTFIIRNLKETTLV